MAPTTTEKTVNILSIRDNDFLNNSRCPIRYGNVRCFCMCSAARVRTLDLAYAATCRQRILREVDQIKMIQPRPGDSSPIWTRLERNVGAVIDKVLCKWHQAQRNMAVRQTMESLKKSCGPPTSTTTAMNSASPYSPHVHDQVFQNNIRTTSHYPTGPYHRVSHNADPVVSQYPYTDVCQSPSNVNMPTSSSSRAHAAPHVATPPPSPASSAHAHHWLPQPISITNNNHVYPATPHHQFYLQSSLASDRRPATVQRDSYLQTHVKAEGDCRWTKTQASAGSTNRKSVTASHPTRQPTTPRVPNGFGIRPPSGSHRSDVEQSHSQAIDDEPSPATKHIVTPDLDTDFVQNQERFMRSELRAETFGNSLEALKVKHHTTLDALGELELAHKALQTEHNAALVQIGILQDEKAESDAQVHDAVVAPVKLRDENEDLRDEMEDLKGEVGCLKEKAEDQEDEIEELRAEIGRMRMGNRA